MNFKEALIAHLRGEKVEVMGIEGVWRSFITTVGDARLAYIDSPSFCSGCSFRLAPRTITVNGVKVPAPERGRIKDGIEYFIPYPTVDSMFRMVVWQHDSADEVYHERGLVYLNKEDAIARSKAMLLTSDK